MAERFAALKDDFLRLTAEIVWCTVTTVDSQGRPRSRVFDLFMNTPPPLGYDLRGFGSDGPGSSTFTPLRLDPSRIQVLLGTEFPGSFTPRLVRL
jgi:hypothetical protein